MKKFMLLLLMPLAVLSSSAQNNDYNMVIELLNGTTVTLGANDVRNLTFNGDALPVSVNTIEEIYAALATKADKSELDELRALIDQLKEKVDPYKEFTVNGVSFKMVKVAGGMFRMGATEEQGSDASDNELPVHSVTLSDYYIGETEVTQALWYEVMGQKPTSNYEQWSSSYGLGDNYPVYYVSWEECQTFITKLNQLTGMQFRLPTEAEWEFAARGGIGSLGFKYAGSNTSSEVAWGASDSSHPVATKAPNELGLYDMSGNVSEWCQDWYDSYSSEAQTNPTGPSSGSQRVLRDGWWQLYAWHLRIPYRHSCYPWHRYYYTGLRLAL